MPGRSFIIAIAILICSSPIYAEQVTLKAAEMEALLSGNTISGDWGGEYKQYFDPDGETVYVPVGSVTDTGKWRVNPDTNEYESWWNATGWVAYTIASDGERYYWVDGEGKRFSFEVMEGNQLDPE